MKGKSKRKGKGKGMGKGKATASATAKTPSTAAERVSAIPELLENVLTFVVKVCSKQELRDDDDHYFYQDGNDITLDQRIGDAKALFRLQRVNRTFRDVIAESPRLRRAMFLEATPRGQNVDDQKIYVALSEYNPLLKDLLPPPIRSWWQAGKGAQLFFNGSARLPKVVEPRLHHFVPASFKSHRTGSWRQMLLNNAAKKIRVVTSVDGDGKNFLPLGGEYILQEGATLGELVDILYDNLRRSWRKPKTMQQKRRKCSEVGLRLWFYSARYDETD